MHISEFDYELSDQLVAQAPLEKRDASRMLVLDRKSQTWTDSDFAALSCFLRPNDLLVVNNTRVFPARLLGRRHPSGGHVEVLLARECEVLVWEALVRPGHRLRKGAVIRFGDDRLSAEMLDEPGEELRKLKFDCLAPLETILNEVGQTPLPPYIRRPLGDSAQDRDRYQTVFARKRGAIAAPTAGLHFTARVLEQLKAEGVGAAEITLHVGYGTFEPVRVDEVELHHVAAERFEINAGAAHAINSTRSAGHRVIAVGTTTTRALESAVNLNGEVEPCNRSTDLTITPGFKFQITDALLTNFHLPRSSLLILVCAFAGYDLMRRAYRHAVEQRYRFYSYGDCMLII